MIRLTQYYAIIFLCGFIASSAFAQNSNVEVNLGVLKDYSPPPMFGAPSHVTATGEEKSQSVPAPSYAAPPDTAQPALQKQKRNISSSYVLQSPEQEKRTRRYRSSIQERPTPSVKQPSPIMHDIKAPKPKRKPAYVAKPPDKKTARKAKSLSTMPALPNDVVKAQNLAPLKSTEQVEQVSNKISLGFLPEVDSLTNEIKPALVKRLRKEMGEAPTMRIEVLAYASDAQNDALKARKLSLARALDVRDFLITNNIDSKSIDVRAFGNEKSTTPLDRVDIMFVRLSQ